MAAYQRRRRAGIFYDVEVGDPLNAHNVPQLAQAVDLLYQNVQAMHGNAGDRASTPAGRAQLRRDHATYTNEYTSIGEMLRRYIIVNTNPTEPYTLEDYKADREKSIDEGVALYEAQQAEEARYQATMQYKVKHHTQKALRQIETKLQAIQAMLSNTLTKISDFMRSSRRNDNQPKLVPYLVWENGHRRAKFVTLLEGTDERINFPTQPLNKRRKSFTR